MNKKSLIVFGFAFSLLAKEEINCLEFEDFPLRKIDKVYSHNGDSVANLIFNVLKTLHLISDLYVTKSAAEGNGNSLIFLKEKCVEDVHKCCIKLKTFKRFTNELIKEWVKKREKTERTQFLLQSIFLCYKSKKIIESIDSEETKEFLENLFVFIKDVYHNGPHAVEKCKAGLSEGDRAIFSDFLEKETLFLL